jgi:hypothetical protein
MQFQRAGFDHILRVVDKFLIELETQLHEKHVALSSTPEARAGWPSTASTRRWARGRWRG